MQVPYLNAQIFGIGQLITQRKKLVVPEHQRDYSWTVDEVSQFLSDIITAFDDEMSSYFIGLIVLLGPIDNAWTILDGQQRLATTTIIYSSIRQWLSDRHYEADAKQIDTEFLRARLLGGDFSPRLVLNETNRTSFDQSVIQSCSDGRLRTLVEGTPKFSSNRLLLEAAEICRVEVSRFAEASVPDLDQQKERLFRLASFLENNIEAVVADVSSEANAYVIFESLNARGNNLSILDLLKNFVFGVTATDDLDEVRRYWSLTSQRIEDRDADDFLKLFWTSRFGRVQSQQLYGRIKSRYRTSREITVFMRDLYAVSEQYIALDDPKHEIWMPFGQTCRQQIEILSLLGSRQVRAPILSAMVRFEPATMEYLLECLITLTVRYQIVGKRRTGLVEIALARLANLIYRGEVADKHAIWEEISSLIPSDEDFFIDFLKYSEKKASRVMYFLAQIELSARDESGLGLADFARFLPTPKELALEHIWPKDLLDDILEPEKSDIWIRRIANFLLIENSLLDTPDANDDPLAKIASYSTNSSLVLTREIETQPAGIAEDLLKKRQERLAKLAIRSWPLPKPS